MNGGTGMKTSSAFRRRMPAYRVVFLLLVAYGGAAAAAPTDNAAEETSRWRCEYCLAPRGWFGQIELGADYLGGDAFKFGDFTGLDRTGLYAVGDLDLRRHDKNGRYWDILGERIGLHSRDLAIATGRQGHYAIETRSREIPRFLFDAALTPYAGAGQAVQTLPSAWVPGGTTGTMPDLARSLRPVALESAWKTTEFGAHLQSGSNWTHRIQYRRQTRDGDRIQGANFLTTSTLLATPVNYVTNEFDAATAYDTRDWYLEFAYYGSFFDDRNDSITWDNPFTPLVAGASRGRLAAAPNNSYNQIAFSTAWRASERIYLSAHAALGRGRQNEVFLPPTLNPDLPIIPLPQTSLDGTVNTTNLNVRLTVNPLSRLNLYAQYLYDAHDNKTPQALYAQVVDDTYVAAPLINLPYGFRRSTVKIEADYSPATRLHFALGGEHRIHDYTYQLPPHTGTESFWGEMRTYLPAGISASGKYDIEHRTVSGSSASSDLLATNNPLLRKYNLADRRRKQFLATIGFSSSPMLNLGLTGSYDQADYRHSTVGLTRSKNYAYTVDLGITPGMHTQVHLYYSRQVTQTNQAGSSLFAAPNWWGNETDILRNAGFEVEIRELWHGLDLIANYTLSLGHGEIGVNTGIPQPVFPALVNRLENASVYARYRANKHLALRIGYLFARYRSSDWAVDDLQPATVPNLVALGISAPSYLVRMPVFALQYAF